jgi:hypothetical protein
VALGARGIELRQDRVVIIEASGYHVSHRWYREAGARTTRGAGQRRSLGGHGHGHGGAPARLLIASLAYFTPSMAWGADDELERDRLELMQQYLHASADRSAKSTTTGRQGRWRKGRAGRTKPRPRRQSR